MHLPPTRSGHRVRHPGELFGLTRLSSEVCTEVGACEAVVEDCSLSSATRSSFRASRAAPAPISACRTTAVATERASRSSGSAELAARTRSAGAAIAAAAKRPVPPRRRSACPRRVRSPAATIAGANGECESFIAPGSDDLANSCGDTECNGSGACQVTIGTACTSNDECDGGHCECVDSTCTSRLCAAGGRALPVLEHHGLWKHRGRLSGSGRLRRRSVL